MTTIVETKIFSGSYPINSLVDQYSSPLLDCLRMIVNKMEQLWKVVVRAFQSFYDNLRDLFWDKKGKREIVPLHPMPSIEDMKTFYRMLGKDKWKEVVDGVHHRFGREVYDRGLHGGSVEPGFISSIEAAFDHVEQTLGQPITPESYLQVHRVACRHFNGSSTATLMGQEKVGIFRNMEDAICMPLKGAYAPSAKGAEEFSRMNLGVLEFSAPSSAKITYRPMTREQVREQLREYISDYYKEMKQAETAEKKLLGIARFTQRLEWLHPVRDGSGRTWILLLGKLLAENGFHPAVLDLPYISACRGLEEWHEYLKQGLVRWEQEQTKLHST